MFLSAAMMLEWLGERRDDARLREGARVLEDSVRSVFAGGQVKPFEFGGSDGTAAITKAVAEGLRKVS
jgi:3-isopropylmalate dehydrogenase